MLENSVFCFSFTQWKIEVISMRWAFFLHIFGLKKQQRYIFTFALLHRLVSTGWDTCTLWKQSVTAIYLRTFTVHMTMRSNMIYLPLRWVITPPTPFFFFFYKNQWQWIAGVWVTAHIPNAELTLLTKPIALEKTWPPNLSPAEHGFFFCPPNPPWKRSHWSQKAKYQRNVM